VPSTFTTCRDLTPERAADAARSADAMRALLSQMALVARPAEGCPRVLLAVALLSGADWMEGELHVELADEHGATRLDVFTEHAGVRERVLPSASFPVPIEEFRAAIREHTELVAPLVARSSEDGGRIVLRPPRAGTVPPPCFEVSEESMSFERPTVRRKNPLAPEAFRSGAQPRVHERD
jgi:hypothetical protein